MVQVWAPQRSSRRAVSELMVCGATSMIDLRARSGATKAFWRVCLGCLGLRDGSERGSETSNVEPVPIGFPGDAPPHALDDPLEADPEAGTPYCGRLPSSPARIPAKSAAWALPALDALAVSLTRKLILAGSAARAPSIKATQPVGVNLMALPARLSSTWRSLAASPTTSPAPSST